MHPPTSLIHTYRSNDVEALFDAVLGEGWTYEAVQLSPGPLDACIRRLRLPRMAIQWGRARARIHSRDHHEHQGVYLTFLLHAAETGKWYGRTFAPDDVLIYFPGEENDVVIPRDARVLGFMIPQDLAGRMGWGVRHVPRQRLGRERIEALARLAESVARDLGDGAASWETVELAQERLVLRLGALLGPWFEGGVGADRHRDSSPSAQYRLVARARRCLEAWDHPRRLDVDALAAELSTSPRTLYRAFANCLGMGPYEYFTVLRLHAFRRAVQRGGRVPGAVTRAASDLGFEHMGRFARRYRRLFGELPSQTLRRRRG